MSGTIKDILAAFSTGEFDPFARQWNEDLLPEAPALPAPEGVVELFAVQEDPSLPWTREGIADGRYGTFAERLQALLDGKIPKAEPLPDGGRVVDLVFQDGTWIDPSEVTPPVPRVRVPQSRQAHPSGLDVDALFADVELPPSFEGAVSLAPAEPVSSAQASSRASPISRTSNGGACPHVAWRPTTHPIPGTLRFAPRPPLVRLFR